MKSGSSIREVAKAAGVSIATVSRTLSNPEQVSDKTRSVVMDAIEKTNYKINRAARNLRMHQSGEILVLVPNLGNPFFSEILSGIEKTFQNTYYNVLIANSLSYDESEDLLASHLENNHADGIIILDGQVSERAHTWLSKNAKKHNVIFACEWIDGLTQPIVRSNNGQGAATAIRYLHSLGHQKIAHVTGPKENILTLARSKGVTEEQERLGLTMDPEWVVEGNFSLKSGYRAAEKILAAKDRPTCVFCDSDQMAFGLISRFNIEGIRVPEDISVMGFDDIELSEFYVPPLTTIRQNRHGIGTTAAERMLALIKNEVTSDSEQECKIEVELVVRNSCRRITKK